VHSNWRLPDNVDKWVSYVFLTPNMHHVHHHEEQPYTDSNYGDLFSIWDRVFGTFRYLPAHEVRFGLDVELFDNEEQLKFNKLIKVPFTKANLSNE
jgi:sterol desaturase/sphingolipid hydroxylase (fatty acid hydroxylase superfamily)